MKISHTDPRARPSLRPVLLLLAFMALAGASRRIAALDAGLDVNEYAHRAWVVSDGFSLGNVYSIAQTPDGYLWLGSEFGLFRFDGIRPVRWQPPAGEHLPDGSVNDLLVTRGGGLWMGMFDGLAHWNGRKLTRLRQFDGRLVTALYEDSEGTVWVGMGFPGRLCSVRHARVRCYGARPDFGTGVWSIFQDRSGTLWAGAQSGLWRMGPGAPARVPIPLPGGRDPHSGPVGLAESAAGRLIVAMHNGGLLQLIHGALVPDPVGIRDANRLLQDRDGSLWIGTIERGLIHVHRGRSDTFTQSDGLSGNVILSLFQDREGNVWVSTSGGLDRFRELPVRTVSAKQGLSSDATTSVLAAADGSIWIGSHDGLSRWRNGKVSLYRRASGLPDDSVQSLFQDHRGRLWAFTDRGLAYLARGRFVAVPAVPGGEVNAIAGDEAGGLWLSAQRDLLRLRDGRLIARIPWTVLGRHHNASALLADPRRGGLWVGFWQGGGISYFKHGRVRATYTAANGLTRGAVADLRLDKGGALWVATLGGGVSRLANGRIATLSRRNGLPCDTVMWTLEDHQHSLWLYTACGLVHIARAQVHAWIEDPRRRIAVSVLGPQDGVRLRSTAASPFAPRAALAPDGKIWFLSGGGVQAFDPGHLAYNSLPPPVHVQRVIADGRVYWNDLRPAAAGTLRLPPRIRDLEIDYAALSLTAPRENQYRYRLDGRDRRWHDVGNRRMAFYTDLPPGHYRFQVVGSNNSGVWNGRGAAIDFVLLPAFWQTLWFRAACIAALCALLLLLYRLRARQLALQFSRTLDARVQERTRIARDLHDTLLQSFQGVLLQFGAAARLLTREPQRARTVLAEAVEQAAQAIEEGREAVQGLRASVAESSDLAAEIARLATALAAQRPGARTPSIRVEARGRARPLHPIERDEIFRIAAEAVRNAVRHSGSAQIEVELRYGAREFRLSVRDDGCGIDPGDLPGGDRAGHFGLRGMRERAALVGGKLTLWSAPGAGMEVELVVPARRAYLSAHGRARREARQA